MTHMIKRSIDVLAIKSLMNRAFDKQIIGTGRIRQILGRPGCIFLIDDHGGMLFECDKSSDFEKYCMTLFITPDGRGSWGKTMIMEAFSWMFSNTDAKCLIGLAKSDTVDLIRGVYPPPGGVFEKIQDNDGFMGQWTYNREDWRKLI